jgi:hypothetical protein
MAILSKEISKNQVNIFAKRENQFIKIEGKIQYRKKKKEDKKKVEVIKYKKERKSIKKTRKVSVYCLTDCQNGLETKILKKTSLMDNE